MLFSLAPRWDERLWRNGTSTIRLCKCLVEMSNRATLNCIQWRQISKVHLNCLLESFFICFGLSSFVDCRRHDVIRVLSQRQVNSLRFLFSANRISNINFIVMRQQPFRSRIYYEFMRERGITRDVITISSWFNCRRLNGFIRPLTTVRSTHNPSTVWASNCLLPSSRIWSILMDFR